MSNITTLPTAKGLIEFDNQKLDLIRSTVAKELTPLEFEMFIAVAKARGLDPVMNQIHAVKRSGRMVLQVGIDGFRLIASRTGQYAGRDETQFEYEDEVKTHPVKAKVTIYRLVNGQRCSWTASAKWTEYFPGEQLGFMWKKLPETMLEKCAEGKALRMAFPNDLSGLYVPEEITERASAAPEKEVGRFDVGEQEKRTKGLLESFRKIGVSEKMLRERYEITDGETLLTDEQIEDASNIGRLITKEKRNVNEFFKLPNYAPVGS